MNLQTVPAGQIGERSGWQVRIPNEVNHLYSFNIQNFSELYHAALMSEGENPRDFLTAEVVTHLSRPPTVNHTSSHSVGGF